MTEKIIVIHDQRVYDALRQQARINRRFVLFAVVATACFYVLNRRIKEIKPAEGE